jgi:hypothetical protein
MLYSAPYQQTHVRQTLELHTLELLLLLLSPPLLLLLLCESSATTLAASGQQIHMDCGGREGG